MRLLLFSTGIFVFSGLLALLGRRSARFSTWMGVGGTMAGCLIGLVPTLKILLGNGEEFFFFPWLVPYGSFHLHADSLSAFFLLPIFILCGASALYGGTYLWEWRDRKSLGAAWFFFNLLTASMVLVVLARNALLFLVAWEVMAISSFFLVTFEDERQEVREAGWTYLVATQLGTAFLLAMFILLGRESHSLDFDQFQVSRANAGSLFFLALMGFGAKAGFMPLHVWLPEAHPAAPSHVSAVMSGVMIKMGVYGLIRILTFLDSPPAWWGWTLVGVGLISGVLGLLFALAQHDLKRLLAYSSVENIGIITVGLGVGIIGRHEGLPLVAMLGYGGALLHALNHSFFKGLLFLSAGSVLHGAGTGALEHLGGLSKRMPLTSLGFLVGSVAICGLPPFNGFVSEFLIYSGAFKGIGSHSVGGVLPLLLVIAGMGLMGGLAAACFARALGITFLGEPRSGSATNAHEAGTSMLFPMGLLAIFCFLTGILAPAVLPLIAFPAQVASGIGAKSFVETMDWVTGPLIRILACAGLFLALLSLLVVTRRRLLAKGTVGSGRTWGCGYVKPSPRMQYTASSFAQPILEVFGAFLGVKKTGKVPEGYFPQNTLIKTETPDAARVRFFEPIFKGMGWGLEQLRWLQHGNVQLYVLYIALTLLGLLLWKLGL